MKIKSIIFNCCSIVVSFGLMGQKVNQPIQAGNDLYKQKKYDQAELQYNNALTLDPSSSTAKFNLANTLYRQGKKDDAIKKLGNLSDNEKEAALKSKIYYNKGVVLSAQEKPEESVEAYKNALRQNPDDNEARENLQKALLELKKKNTPQKKEDNPKKRKQPQQKQQQPEMSPKEAEQRLKLLEQKEKEVQQRLQKEKAKAGAGQTKDW